MNPYTIIVIIGVYFGLLLIISSITSRGANNQSFFLGNRQSPWYIVAIGMIGASLSGATFISVPGEVINSHFYYLQMVLGYILGYIVIAFVLLPVYYKLQLTSIYTYLGLRFGNISYKTGSSLFLISRLIGASLRLLLVAKVLQIVVFEKLGVPFYATVIITLILIWVYTFKGGIKTIVWTDTLQTIFMILAVVLTFIFLAGSMDLSLRNAVQAIGVSGYSDIFDFSGWQSGTYFWKHFLSGMFITIVMTGLDQDMMQKNLSCRNLRDAQKNMLTYSFAFIPVNLVFLAVGALLYIFALQNSIQFPNDTDDIFAMIATGGYLPAVVSIFFILGLIAAAYSSADSALTSLTTSFLVDILGVENNSEDQIKAKRIVVHLMMSGILALLILIFKAKSNENVITNLFKFAGYTYGPLLGLYSFGLFTTRKIKELPVPAIAVSSSVIVYIISQNSEAWLGGYKMGFEALIYNGLLTFTGLFLVSKRKRTR